MKSKNIIIALLSLFTVLAVSCNNTNDKANPAPEQNTSQTTTVAEKAPWVGTYYGVLPAASAPGIKTYITLNEDNTYLVKEEYTDKDFKPEPMTGTLKWNDDKTIITIGEKTYLVGQNTLTALDINNKVIEGKMAEDYILRKQ